MNTDVALFWIQESIKTGAMLAAPILGIALAVGLMVSLFQAITSIQEMTLSYIPKMVAVGIILLLFAPWLIQMRSEEHTSELQSRGHLVCRLLLETKKPKPSARE